MTDRKVSPVNLTTKGSLISVGEYKRFSLVGEEIVKILSKHQVPYHDVKHVLKVVTDSIGLAPVQYDVIRNAIENKTGRKQ